ncbi:MAG TPA: hypothetical protein VGL58_00265 [Caulobacteraceae bacterium]|jgi:hypothetical protein
MAKAADVANDELRAKLETAFAAMRAGKGADAVHACADAYLRFVDLYPEAKVETVAMRGGRRMSRLMRWPALGSTMSADSIREGAPKIEFQRERFAVAEAMTYYQFVLDEVLEHQGA